MGGDSLASPDELKENLRRQIDDLQNQINQYRENISGLQSQGKSLNREISLLDSKMKSTALEIKRTDLSIQQAEMEIGNKNTALEEAEKKLGREREIIAQSIRQIDERDEQGILEMILKNQKLSDLFEEVNSLRDIQESIQKSMAEIEILKVDLANDKEILEGKIEELGELKNLQQIQKKALVSQQEEKKNLLAQTKGQESDYQKLLQKASQDAAAIRNNLYLLEGSGVSMSLEKAYNYAKLAGDLTGVRPAFLLAVLKKESSWGGNVGTGTWRKDMRPADRDAFVLICEKLGLNPDTTPVSKKPWYGWGGAMGPAQFLPTTWLGYESKIAQLTGHNPPDPWDIGDAFTAAGIMMSKNGASAQTRDAEWRAAQIYFAGGRWNNPTYYFYGDQVMELAGVIQEQLNIITK